MKPTKRMMPPPPKHYYYLASPYTKYHAGINQAFIDVCGIAGRLMKQGTRLFSPIAHSHAIAGVSEAIDPLDHEFWLDADEPMMDACSALLVAKLPGFDESDGVQKEIDRFLEMRKPVFFLDPQTLKVSYEKG